VFSPLLSAALLVLEKNGIKIAQILLIFGQSVVNCVIITIGTDKFLKGGLGK